MRNLLTVIAVTAALAMAPAPAPAGIVGLFGFDLCGGHNHGCAQCGNCGNCCEPACGCDSCGECCEPACGCTSCCEPCCGCGTGCFANGCQYAGQCYTGCCESHAPICCCRDCVGCGGCGGSTCGSCCEPACGCDSCGQCCEPACGCDSCCSPCGGCGSCGSGCATWCGNGTACSPRKCCAKYFGFGSCCGHLINALCCGSSGCGCNGEVYWNEWHNDPPCCHDPCDQCGQWNGPRAGCGCNGGCSNGSCGCHGGCSTGSCGCNGGYANSQSAAVGNGAAYAKQQVMQQRTPVASSGRQYRPANLTRPAGSNAHNQQMVASRNSQQQPQQQQQTNPNVRTAARPMPNHVQAAGGNYNATQQQRPILW